MVRKVLVDLALTDEMKSSGDDLVTAMERFPLEGSLLKAVDAAFWVREASDWESRWRFYIAAPGISFEGPLKGYDWIQRALRELARTAQGPLLPFDMIAIVDTDAPIIKALRESFGTSVIRDYHPSDRFFGTYYFEEIYINRLDPTHTLQCTVQNPAGLKWGRGDNHAYIIGSGLVNLHGAAIIGHGAVKKNGTLQAKIDLPVKYGIDSCELISCEAVMPTAIYTEGQEPEWKARIILIRPV
jgi:hypothetical protein